MLIQPYVENAVRHGLLHKEGGGQLHVRFRLEGNMLHCTVEDNGIGRQKAAELKQERRKGHQSLGTALTAERLDVLRKSGFKGIEVRIEDLLDGEAPAGTRVHLTIPVQYNY